LKEEEDRFLLRRRVEDSALIFYIDLRVNSLPPRLLNPLLEELRREAGEDSLTVLLPSWMNLDHFIRMINDIKICNIATRNSNCANYY
jgi:hypothetical protein